MRFKTDGLELTETHITDRLGTVGVDNLPDPQPINETRLSDRATPIMQRLWAVALADVESNIVEDDTGRSFGAGTGFGTRVYTRDICLSGDVVRTGPGRVRPRRGRCP